MILLLRGASFIYLYVALIANDNQDMAGTPAKCA